jgi:hypothetical protein
MLPGPEGPGSRAKGDRLDARLKQLPPPWP